MKNILKKGEKILWEGRPKKISYLVSRLVPLIIILLVFGTFSFFVFRIFFKVSDTASSMTNLNLNINDLTKNPKKIESQFRQIYENYKQEHEKELKEIEEARTKEDTEHSQKLSGLSEEHQQIINRIQGKYFENIMKWKKDYSNIAYQKDLSSEKTRYENEVNLENERYNNQIASLETKYGLISDIVSYVDEDGSVNISSLTSENYNNMLENFNVVSGAVFNIFSIFKIIALLPFALVLLLLVSGIVGVVIQSRKLYYAATDRRLIIQHGIIGLDYRSFEYTKIDDLYVKVGLFDKIFKTGSISLVVEYGLNGNRTSTFQHIFGENNAFLNIEKPYEVFNKIQKISKDLRTDVYYPNDLRPKENKGYKTKYKR